MVYDAAMIDRKTDIRLVRTAVRRSRVVALLGPRQCGKTTLARQFVPADSLNYFDLEDPESLARLSEPAISAVLPPICSGNPRKPWPAP
jgi:predicted AAA+ superfamily ATPase